MAARWLTQGTYTHSRMREGCLAGRRMRAAADQPGRGDRVVRRPERPHGDQAAARVQAGYGLDPGDLYGLGRAEWRKDRRKAAREHRLAGPRRPVEVEVVAAGRRHLECGDERVVAPDVGEVEHGLGFRLRLAGLVERSRVLLPAHDVHRLGGGDGTQELA